MAAATLAWVPLLTLSHAHLPQRPAQALPVTDRGFLVLVAETYPELEYVSQRYGSTGETVHVWRDVVRGDFAVYRHDDRGQHTVMESGAPWHDALTRLAGMWDATATTGGHR